MSNAFEQAIDCIMEKDGDVLDMLAKSEAMDKETAILRTIEENKLAARSYMRRKS